MVTTELGACEWFVWDLRRSNLIDRGQLDQLVSEFLQKQPRAEPANLAEYLVSQGILSQFQAERLLQGKTQGFVLGPFTLMDSLGVGSMGTVYKAVSKTDNNWYAVKVLPRRSMWNVRIARRKVRAFESCKHPAVVPFVDVGTSGGMHYLAWPFVHGETLENYVKQEGPLSPEQTASFAFQLAEGLEVCHHHDLFHGLFKPSNIMLTTDGELCILDFGIGCLLAETEGESLVDTMSTANSVASGLDCASPESIMDPTNLNPVGDQYSLGCVMYFCLTGNYPFPDGSAAELMMAHQFKEPAPLEEQNPNVPPELAAIVNRLMKKKPDERYPSTAELVEALRPHVGEPVERDRAEQIPSWTKQSASPTTDTPPLGGTPRDSIPKFASFETETETEPQPKPVASPGLPRGAQPTMAGMQRDALTSLPSRQTLRDEASSGPPKLPSVAQEEPDDQEIPGGYDEESRPRWEERLGPIGIAIGATVAALVAWFLAARFFE